MSDIFQKLGFLKDRGYEEWNNRDCFYSEKNKHVMSVEFIEAHSIERLKKEVWKAMSSWHFSFVNPKIAKQAREELTKEIMSFKKLII